MNEFKSCIEQKQQNLENQSNGSNGSINDNNVLFTTIVYIYSHVLEIFFILFFF